MWLIESLLQVVSTISDLFVVLLTCCVFDWMKTFNETETDTSENNDKSEESLLIFDIMIRCTGFSRTLFLKLIRTPYRQDRVMVIRPDF